MLLWQDLRFSVRFLRTHLAFATIVILVLGIGIGANTAVFTLANAVLFRPLPFPGGDRVLVLYCENLPKGLPRLGVSYPDFEDWRKQAKSLASLAAWDTISANLSDRSAMPERYSAARLSANGFSVLQQKPVIGRDFSAADDQAGADPVVLLGNSIWKRRYGGDPHVLGRAIRINDVPRTIVGVLPEGMRFPINSDLWIPMQRTPAMNKRDARDVVVFGRLADGVSLSGAQSEMRLIASRLEAQYPRSNAGITIEVHTFNEAFNGGVIRTIFLSLFGAVGFVLLIACANVASLMLSRALSRSREISIRAALGASRWRLIRQLLTESVLLSVGGGVLGLGLALAGVRIFNLAVAAVDKPYWIKFTMDFTVFGYIAGLSIATGILFGLAPALHASRFDLNERLKEGTRGSGGSSRSRLLSSGLVVIELALAVILLASAGLMIRSFFKLYGIQENVKTANLLTMRVDLPETKYPTPESRARVYDQIHTRLAALPGMESVAFASDAPIQGSQKWKFQLESQAPPAPGKEPSVAGLLVTPDYFRTAGASMVRGRSFEPSDGGAGNNFVVVNQRFAGKYWPGQDPLGKRVRLVRDKADDWFVVSGVSPDIRQNDPSEPDIDPVVYLPYRKDAASWASILCRTLVSPAAMIPDIRKQVQAIDQDLPVFRVLTMDEVFEQQRWAWRVFGGMFFIFACVALVLSAIGIYGVMGYAVVQRRQELGVRIALGATPRSILSTVLSGGAMQIGLGLALGMIGAFAVTRVIKALLIQVSPTDPATFALVAGVLAATAMLACWLPARRALKVDPAVVLRYE